MDIKELQDYVIANNISWQVDGDTIYLNNPEYKETIRLTPQGLANLKNIGELDRYIINGRNIDHITRVTGYFSKVSGWNPGKTGELKDRDKTKIEEVNK